MSHTGHGEKGLHKQAAIDHKAAAHHDHVSVAAYYLAEHRGFDGADPAADWLAAETEINAMLKKSKKVKAH